MRRHKIVLYYNDLVFQPSESFLYKDFGQVPYVLSELYDTDLEYWIGAAKPNPDLGCFRGKRVRQFGKSLGWLPARLDFLRNRALHRAIDRELDLTHLVLFPFTPLTDLSVVRRVRRRRPDAKIIIKLDANRDYLDALQTDWRRTRRSPVRFARQWHHYHALLNLADLVVCETSDCERMLRDGFLGLELRGKLAKTFSGLSERWLASIGVRDTGAGARRRSIIVSGRISSWQKNTALIFEAGPPPPGWTIEFVGEVDSALQTAIDARRAADPEFDAHYRFHGVVTDKRAYFDILMRAQVLLLNSRGGEGFPNVFAEAHFCRLFIVTSDVSGAEDATDSGRWGLICPRDDAAALRAALQALPKLVPSHRDGAAQDAYRQCFVWEHSLDQPVIRRLFDVSPN